MNHTEAKLRAFATELAALCARFRASIGGAGFGHAFPTGEVDGEPFHDLDADPESVELCGARIGLITAAAPALHTCGKCHLVGVPQYLPSGAILTEDRCGGCPTGGAQ